MPFGSHYTVNRAMYEVISRVVDTPELIKNDGGVIFGGRQRAFVVALLLSSGAEDLFVVCILRKNK